MASALASAAILVPMTASAGAAGPGPNGLGPSGCVASDPVANPEGGTTCSFVEDPTLQGGWVGAAASWSVSVQAPITCPTGATPPCWGPATTTSGSGPANGTPGAIPAGDLVTVTVSDGVVAAGNATGTNNA
jgi:hypothetical protein